MKEKKRLKCIKSQVQCSSLEGQWGVLLTTRTEPGKPKTYPVLKTGTRNKDSNHKRKRRRIHFLNYILIKYKLFGVFLSVQVVFKPIQSISYQLSAKKKASVTKRRRGSKAKEKKEK